MKYHTDWIINSHWSDYSKILSMVKNDNKISDEMIKLLISNPYLSYQYAMTIGKRFLEGENIISTQPSISIHYAENLIKKRWLKCEKKLLEKDTESYYIFYYIVEVVKKPLKKFHIILLNSKQNKLYVNWLKNNNFLQYAELLI
jgi:hypothetical protein